MGPVEISGARFFTVEEARAILPIVYRITEGYSMRVHELIDKIEKLSGSDTAAAILEIETQVNNLISQWQLKLQKLGAQPKGLWIADFDSGDGYFCWKYPETQLEYWHAYSDGFTKRVHISKRPKPPPKTEPLPQPQA